MDPNILHSAGYLLYILALFAGAGVVAWLTTRKFKPKQKTYGMVFTFLVFFPALVTNIAWDTWQIHLLFPLVYLFLVNASQHKGVSNFSPLSHLRYDNPALALGVFFIYAFASTLWAYFPVQSFMIILFQFISISFVYLIFIHIQYTYTEMFADNGKLVQLFLIIGIGSFVLLLLVSHIVPEIYSIAISLSEEKIKEISADQTISKYFEYLTRLILHRNFFDSGFTFFAVLAFPLAMLMPNRKASLLLLGGIFLAILLISNSQAAMLGLFCGICIVFFLPKIPRWAQQITPWIMLAGITFFPFFTFLLLAILEFFNFALVKESHFFTFSLGPRLWIYENTILLDIWTRPWFGHGIAIHLGQSNISIFDMFFAASVHQHAHNHTLALLIEFGIVGLLLFLWVCACILRAIQNLNEQFQPYALGAFFSALCLTAFTQPLWGIGLIIWCVVFLMFAFFGRYPSAVDYQTNSAI